MHLVSLGLAYNRRSVVAYRQNKVKAAEQDIERSLEFLELAAERPNSPDVRAAQASGLLNIGLHMAEGGKIVDGRKRMDSAVEIHRALAEENKMREVAELATALQMRGYALAINKEEALALKDLDESIMLFHRMEGAKGIHKYKNRLAYSEKLRQDILHGKSVRKDDR